VTRLLWDASYPGTDRPEWTQTHHGPRRRLGHVPPVQIPDRQYGLQQPRTCLIPAYCYGTPPHKYESGSDDSESSFDENDEMSSVVHSSCSDDEDDDDDDESDDDIEEVVWTKTV
jgi:hypothetical protein